MRVVGGPVSTALPLLAVLVATILFASGHEEDQSHVWDWLFVLGLGVLVGSAEVLSRYRDAPARAMASTWAGIYVALNGTASVLALGLIRAFGFEFGLGDGTGDGADVRWVQVLVGGTGAMAVLRASLFSVQVSGNDVAIGPGAFMQVFLNVANEAVDRGRGANRSSEVARIMAGVSFERAAAPLPQLCISLRQNLQPEDAASLLKAVGALASRKDIDDGAKALLLGLELMNVFGASLLEEAVTSSGNPIRYRPTEVARIMSGVSFVKAVESLPSYALALSNHTGGPVVVSLRDNILQLRHSDSLDDATRALTLGIELAKVVGEDRLGDAVTQLGESIRN